MVTAVLDAALYISCREFGIPKSLKEIAGVNNIKPKCERRLEEAVIVHHLLHAEEAKIEAERDGGFHEDM